MNQHTGYEAIRQTYGVPVEYGTVIRFRPLPDLLYIGRVISARDCKLWVRMFAAFDENGRHELNKRMGPFHPTWQMEYKIGDEWVKA